MWNDLDKHYVSFEIKQIDWDSLRTFYRPRAVAECGQHVDGQTAQRIEGRGDGNKSRGEDDQERGQCSAQPSCVHERITQLSPVGSAAAD